MDEARVFQALSDGTRLEILRLLAPCPLNVTRIVGRLKAAQPAVSRHLKILREAALIRGERKGKEIEYSVEPDAVLAVAGYLERLMEEAMVGGVTARGAAADVTRRRQARGAGGGGGAGCGRGVGAGARAKGTAKTTQARPAQDFVRKEQEYTVERKPKDLDDFLL